MSLSEKYKQVVHYHETTKHQPRRSAKSLGFMDWANQPNPFRFFENSPLLRLPFIQEDSKAPHQNLFSPDNSPPQPYSLKMVAAIAELSLALSAWKVVPGSKWSLRINPSSGNLHPTESYWLLPETQSLPEGFYHYDPFSHGMALRTQWDPSLRQIITNEFDSEGFFVILTSIFLRESWKYGERAYRYCNHDVGHALAALSFAANLQGWQVTALHETDDESLQKMLGLDRFQLPEGEQEEPDVVCWFHPRGTNSPGMKIPESIINTLSTSDLVGTPEPLTQSIHPWPIIKQTAETCVKPQTEPIIVKYPGFEPLNLPETPLSAATIIRTRRSAVSFDPQKSEMSLVHFLGMLDATLPRPNIAPFYLEIGHPQVHLFVFVHRVTGLEPGLYVFIRDPAFKSELKQKTKPEFLWQVVDHKVSFFLLQTGDMQDLAARLSCQQEIAGESAFSLGMVAHFSENLQKKPYLYKHLFWETGMIGQVLYLQAEAYGFRGTGIGCFFDDLMHNVCGFKDNHFQSLYHFTIGYPVDDSRISTQPPYFHLQESED